jgi:hypothetical protein
VDAGVGGSGDLVASLHPGHACRVAMESEHRAAEDPDHPTVWTRRRSRAVSLAPSPLSRC